MAPVRPHEDHAHPWRTLACVVVGVFMVILDTTVVNVAFPTLQREYGAPITDAQWIVSLYVLVLGVTTPLAGFLADRFGVKRMYLLGLGLFVAGSAACGLAPTLPALIAGRILQGIGGGITQPSGTALLYRAFPPSAIGRAFGYFGLALLVAPAAGPVLGGWLVDHGLWRWIFFLNIPVGLAGLVAGRAWLAEWRLPEAPALDWRGLALSTLGFGALLAAAGEGRQLGLTDPVVVSLLGAGALALGALWLHARRVEHPILELRLFAQPVFAAANLVGWIGVVGLFAAQFLLPLYLELLRGLSPGEVGLLLLAQPLAAAVASPLAGRLYDRIGPRPLAVSGFLALTLSTWGLVGLSTTSSLGLIRFLLVLRGFAFGLTIQTTFTTALAVVPRERVARASALISSTRFAIQALAVAALGTIVSGTGTQALPRLQDFALAYAVTLVFAAAACALALRLPGWPAPWGGRAALAGGPPRRAADLPRRVDDP